ncbi:MAG: threonine/serine exporter family protein [Candidatus Metalachnospira sp.]|nr:threonine/serine exporter family protein [Candidatus Metalachnospira sp.]
MKTIIIEMVMASMACMFFAIVYNTPKKELLFCWIFGGIGYGIYYYLMEFRGLGTFSNFFGAFAIAVLSRFTSVKRQIPVMVYVLPSVFPLSPGGNMYNACYAFITCDLNTSMFETMKCIKIVGMCVIAIIIVLSLPDFMFGTKKTTINKTDTV